MIGHDPVFGQDELTEASEISYRGAVGVVIAMNVPFRRAPMHYATKPILLPAALLLACSLPGFLAARTTSTTDARGAIDPPTVVGTVIDEQGRPRKGVTVQISGMEKLHPGGWVRVFRLGIMPSFTTDERGRFEIPFNEEDLRFDLWCDDWAFAPTFVHAIAADSEDLTIVLKRGVEVLLKTASNSFR